MIRFRNSFWLVSAVLLVAGCGGSTSGGGGGTTGGGGGTTGGGGGGATTPTVSVTASPSSITTAQSTTVTVTVSGTGAMPTGSITLTSGSYNSGAKTLVNGSAQIAVQGSVLATAADTLSAAYTPDTGSSSTYNSATGTGSVTVTAPSLLTPTVTVSASPSSITSAQSTTVTVTVSGAGAMPTGSITLTSGSYSSGAKTLVNGSVPITVQGSVLATAADTLSAAYTPDAGSSSTYNSATGTGSVTVTSATQVTPTVTATPNPSSIGSAQQTVVTVTVTGTGATPTGSITLTSGSYNSGAQTLVSGSVPITIQGTSLANGNDLLTAHYTPDAGSSSTYNSASGFTTVNVTGALAITSFTASPNPIPVGSTSTQLTAVFAGGTGVITPGSIPVTSNTPVTVSPTSTTIYTLTVTPTTGSPITATTTVNVQVGVTLDFGTTYQTIDGFGTSTAWLGQMSTAVATALYSPSNGLGLSILRMRIDYEGTPAGGGTHGQPYETSQWDAELANGMEAVANNPNAKVFATPWTPPLSMKSSSASQPYNSSCGTVGPCGGYLDPTSDSGKGYADYANYLKDFVTFFNTYSGGINLYGISMQNEPDYANVGYESCYWNAAQMDAFVASLSGPNALGAKLIMPESFQFLPSQAATTLNDSNAVGNVSIIGGHIYGVQPSAYPFPTGVSRPLWMTEYGPGSGTTPSFSSVLTTFGESIHNSMVNGNYNAYVWWGAFGNAPGVGATNAGSYGLVDGGGTQTVAGWVFGQFSKFIQPGFVRVSATSNPASGVYVSAYHYTGGISYTNTVAIVAINANTSPEMLTFTVNNGSLTSLTPYQSTSASGLAAQPAVSVSGGGQFTYTLPAQSITTFVQ